MKMYFFILIRETLGGWEGTGDWYAITLWLPLLM